MSKTSTDNLPVIVPIIYELGYVPGNVMTVSREIDDLLEHGTRDQWETWREQLLSVFNAGAEALDLLRGMLQDATTATERHKLENDMHTTCFALGIGHALSVKFGEPFDHPCYTQADVEWFHVKVLADVEYQKQLKALPADAIALSKMQPLTEAVQ